MDILFLLVIPVIFLLIIRKAIFEKKEIKEEKKKTIIIATGGTIYLFVIIFYIFGLPKLVFLSKPFDNFLNYLFPILFLIIYLFKKNKKKLGCYILGGYGILAILISMVGGFYA